MASSINASTAGGGGVIVTSDATGNLNIQSGGSTVVAVTSAGAAVTGTLSATGASTFTGTGKFATTIGVGNATPAASGSGITFPATQSASSDANTLDDYEEGTWTPSYQGSSVAGTVTYTSRGGIYTKIGNTVTAWFSLVNFTSTSATGDLLVSGLPFSALFTNNVRSCVSANIRAYNIDLPAGAINITTDVQTSTSYAGFLCTTDNSAWATVSVKNGSSLYLEGYLTYTVS